MLCVSCSTGPNPVPLARRPAAHQPSGLSWLVNQSHPPSERRDQQNRLRSNPRFHRNPSFNQPPYHALQPNPTTNPNAGPPDHNPYPRKIDARVRVACVCIYPGHLRLQIKCGCVGILPSLFALSRSHLNFLLSPPSHESISPADKLGRKTANKPNTPS